MRAVRCGRHKSETVYKPRRLNHWRTRCRWKPIKQMHVQLYPLLFSNKDFRSFKGTRTYDNCLYFATLPLFHYTFVYVHRFIFTLQYNNIYKTINFYNMLIKQCLFSYFLPLLVCLFIVIIDHSYTSTG